MIAADLSGVPLDAAIALAALAAVSAVVHLWAARHALREFRAWHVAVAVMGVIYVGGYWALAFTDITGNSTLSAGAVVALEWSTDGATHSMRVNNTAQTITVVAGTNNGDWFGDTSARDNFVIGALVTTTTGYYFDGAIAYLGVFNAPLSSGDHSDLYAWIAAHYGV